MSDLPLPNAARGATSVRPVESLVAETLGVQAGVGNRSDWSFLSESSLSTARVRAGRQRSLIALGGLGALAIAGAALWGSFRSQPGSEVTAALDVAAAQPSGPLDLPGIGDAVADLLPRLGVHVALWVGALAAAWWVVSRYRRRRVSRPMGAIAKSVLLTITAVVVAVGAFTTAFDVYYIPTGSMRPTLQVQDRILVDPSDTDLAIGDVVIHDFGQSRPTLAGFPSVRRLVAAGGDVVEGRDGELLVNGEPSPWLAEWKGLSLGDFGPVTVGADELFTMGDNHPGSDDSRWNGPVHVDNVRGTVRAVLWSPGAG